MAENGCDSPPAQPVTSWQILCICVFIFLTAFIFRFNRLGTISSFTGDEAMHIASAANYTERGYFGPDNWYHPPMKHILLYGSMRLFGDNPFGWRLRNVVFGAATVVILFILTHVLFRSLAVAAFSSVLLMLDPLHIMFSRSTFEDVPAVFFMLAALLTAVSAIRENHSRNWVLTGILFGLALSLRWYAAGLMLIVLVASALNRFHREGFPGAIRVLVYLALLPVLVYVLSFTPWFLKGYSLPEWILMQADALREMGHLSASTFHPILNELGGPAKWFVSGIAVGFNLKSDADWGTFIVIMNNLPVWLFVLPAVFYMSLEGIRKLNRDLLIIGLTFFSLYLPLVLLSRPIFLYTSLSILPFGFIAVSWSARQLLNRRVYLLIIPVTLWCLLLYPLIVGMSVPLDLYRPLLEHIRIFKPL